MIEAKTRTDLAGPTPQSSDALSEIPSRWNGRFSITVTLATAICLLVLISVGSVLGAGIWLAQKNTLALLSTNANQGVANTVERIRQHLLPAEQGAGYIARQIAEGKIDPSDRGGFGKVLIGALAAAPQIEAVSYIDADLQSFLAGRPKGDDVSLMTFDYANDPQIRQRWRALTRQPAWTPPLWRQDHDKTYMNLGFPVVRDDEIVAAVVAAVSVRELSTFLRDSKNTDAGTNFVLYGRDHVLAHALMSEGYPGRSVERPLPELSRFEDRVLAAIWQREDRAALSLTLAPGTSGHWLRTGDEEYVFVFRELTGFGPKPLIVGTYFHLADVGTEMRRMFIALFAGLGALLLALIAAAVLGRRIARPIVRFSAAASRVRDLDVAEIGTLPRSVFRELDEQSKAFNAMLHALRWFELYVPKKIVERLIRRGEIGEKISAEREVTVMFTDIAEFSALSEGMSAPEVAAFVNHHFGIVASCIEAEDGTVDKFIGDSVMAIWGAPDPQPDAAERACRAALAIAQAIRTENAQRRAEGSPPVRIRIGIHTGSATVGNIGAPGRINYTIIGDAVNVGQRLEQLGKELYPAGSEVAILISGATASALGSEFQPVSAGEYKLKGRAGQTEVFRLS